MAVAAPHRLAESTNLAESAAGGGGGAGVTKPACRPAHHRREFTAQAKAAVANVANDAVRNAVWAHGLTSSDNIFELLRAPSGQDSAKDLLIIAAPWGFGNFVFGSSDSIQRNLSGVNDCACASVSFRRVSWKVLIRPGLSLE